MKTVVMILTFHNSLCKVKLMIDGLGTTTCASSTDRETRLGVNNSVPHSKCRVAEPQVHGLADSSVPQLSLRHPVADAELGEDVGGVFPVVAQLAT